MHLALLPAVLGTVLFAFPFTFAQELDSGAVHQQVQGRGAGTIGQLNFERLLATAQRAVVPVSYTHLDVYKRQRLRRCGVTAGRLSG